MNAECVKTFRRGDRVSINVDHEYAPPFFKHWSEAYPTTASIIDTAGEHAQIAFDRYLTDERGTQLLLWIHHDALERIA